MIRRVLSLVGAAVVLGAGASCSSVQPAGSLGYVVNGDPLADPPPTNYMHVPPTDQTRGPMQWRTKF